MAALNSTQVGVKAAAQDLCFTGADLAQLEKISCWQGGFFQANPFEFFGKRIRVGELVQSLYDDDRGFVDESIVYDAKVVAVHIGSAEDGIETSLLLKQDNYVDPDYIDVSRLTVLKVLS